MVTDALIENRVQNVVCIPIAMRDDPMVEASYES
jgi:hypothetical protein